MVASCWFPACGEYCQKCTVRRVGTVYKASRPDAAAHAKHGMVLWYNVSHKVSYSVIQCCRTVSYGPVRTGKQH